ncbi:DNA gyrase subunit A [Propionibacterium cyclohexanicum]|uniref:DNA topoisomerase (ATP-hydrolyzing) n=1 Tax=Propionibacterium cyclohexanicum TaxID=64702 RepID=A0A1H9QPP4_9ACTN|nr:DNA topoisomerase IV subunit A [Propionibacterium cyclohexanicum]SER62387.1 DNA gyrase subunit A [Propionibacterium cyclohexanicum]
MAASKTAEPEDDFEERIIDVDVTQEMENSYLEYAYSVIYSRALPDARDGLKPVQRRILYGMHEQHLLPDHAFVKCARVVGEVMGKLHPHGDSAIYDALVRMGQDWSMRLQLVDGHGNFGSLDAGPAAMRYTECRLNPAALPMLEGLDEDTVDFRPNYDGKGLEPSVLPAAFPNLLVNGATGIAVGMATNIPSHNLAEVVQALVHLLAHPDAELDTLMSFIPGPDLPTGGKIIGLAGIRDAYATGRGIFKIRASTRIEQVSPRRRGIVVTELPFGVGPEKVMEQIKHLVQAKKISGIADIKDLTDLANGLRLVIEVKNGINPEALLDQLFRHTKLEDSFGINAVALVDGQPRTMGLKQMLQVYLDHRLEVCLRRAQFQLRKAQDRLHIVQGLLLAMVGIDDVIAIIRSSDDVPTARTRLMEAFELDEVQANYILDLQLRRLTRLSRLELEAERDDLQRRIAELSGLIADPQKLRAQVRDELRAISKKFGTARRTVLLEATRVPPAGATPLEVPDDPCWVMLSSTGLMARMNRAEDRPGLPDAGPRSAHDVIVSAVATSAHSDFGVITNHGRLLRAHAIDLPEVVSTANAPSLRGGSRARELLALGKNEHVIALCSLDPNSAGLALGTRRGIVKRVVPEVLTKDAWEVISLAAGDELVGAAELVDECDELVFVSSDAQLLHFPASLVRPQGRGGHGVAGIRLADGASAIWFGVSPSTDAVVVTAAGSSTALPGTEAGTVKVTSLDQYPAKGRATGGVRCHRFLRGEDALTLAWVGPQPAVAASSSGIPVQIPPATGRRDGSGTPLAQALAAVSSRVMPH